ncbi:putative phosphomevalonate kinase [Helianthus debilis subsp. tardiflorus]
MTTAVVVALLNYLGVVDLPYSIKDQKGENSLDLDLMHMIAQTTHCIAQGKVGSGFDVSSAVYGSNRYVRFSPKIISATQEVVCTTPLDEVIGEVLKAKWDHESTKFSFMIS